MSNTSFATAINCIDGRTQLAVIDFIKQKTGVAYVDMITEPGVVRLFADPETEGRLAAIQKAVAISVTGHKSQNIFIAAHHDCLANPVADGVQKEQLLKALAAIPSWGLPAKVFGLWVNADRQVEEMCRIRP